MNKSHSESFLDDSHRRHRQYEAQYLSAAVASSSSSSVAGSAVNSACVSACNSPRSNASTAVTEHDEVLFQTWSPCTGAAPIGQHIDSLQFPVSYRWLYYKWVELGQPKLRTLRTPLSIHCMDQSQGKQRQANWTLKEIARTQEEQIIQSIRDACNGTQHSPSPAAGTSRKSSSGRGTKLFVTFASHLDILCAVQAELITLEQNLDHDCQRSLYDATWRNLLEAFEIDRCICYAQGPHRCLGQVIWGEMYAWPMHEIQTRFDAYRQRSSQMQLPSNPSHMSSPSFAPSRSHSLPHPTSTPVIGQTMSPVTPITSTPSHFLSPPSPYAAAVGSESPLPLSPSANTSPHSQPPSYSWDHRSHSLGPALGDPSTPEIPHDESAHLSGVPAYPKDQSSLLQGLLGNMGDEWSETFSSLLQNLQMPTTSDDALHECAPLSHKDTPMINSPQSSVALTGTPYQSPDLHQEGERASCSSASSTPPPTSQKEDGGPAFEDSMGGGADKTDYTVLFQDAARILSAVAKAFDANANAVGGTTLVEDPQGIQNVKTMIDKLSHALNETQQSNQQRI